MVKRQEQRLALAATLTFSAVLKQRFLPLTFQQPGEISAGLDWVPLTIGSIVRVTFFAVRSVPTAAASVALFAVLRVVLSGVSTKAPFMLLVVSP